VLREKEGEDAGPDATKTPATHRMTLYTDIREDPGRMTLYVLRRMTLYSGIRRGGRERG